MNCKSGELLQAYRIERESARPGVAAERDSGPAAERARRSVYRLFGRSEFSVRRRHRVDNT